MIVYNLIKNKVGDLLKIKFNIEALHILLKLSYLSYHTIKMALLCFCFNLISKGFENFKNSDTFFSFLLIKGIF
jgi:hypothetical protein